MVPAGAAAVGLTPLRTGVRDVEAAGEREAIEKAAPGHEVDCWATAPGAQFILRHSRECLPSGGFLQLCTRTGAIITQGLSQGAFAQIRREVVTKARFDTTANSSKVRRRLVGTTRKSAPLPTLQSGRNARSREDRGTAFPSRATSLQCTPFSEVFRATVLEALCVRSIIFKLQ